MNYLVAVIFSALFSLKTKSSLFTFFYLSLLPFIVFSGETPVSIFFSLLLGFILFFIFQKPKLSNFLIFSIVLITIFIIVKPRLGLDMSLLNNVNAQKGEHPDFQTSLVAKLIHNKAELVHSYISNFDKLLSPVAVFASGFWHKIDPYYPLGFLFPWDLYFIYRYFRYKKINLKDKPWKFFIIALSTLFILSGVTYIDQALLFGFAVVYFLALLAAHGYETASKKTRLVFLGLNLLFLFYQLNITSYFKI